MININSRLRTLLILIVMLFFSFNEGVAIQNINVMQQEKNLAKDYSIKSKVAKHLLRIFAKLKDKMERSATLAKRYGILTVFSLILGVLSIVINIPFFGLVGIGLLTLATVFFVLSLYHGNVSYYQNADKGERYQFVKITVIVIATFLSIISSFLYFLSRR